ncbi:hypothetical protein [Aurantivibrio infirmus]
MTHSEDCVEETDKDLPWRPDSSLAKVAKERALPACISRSEYAIQIWKGNFFRFSKTL